MGISTMQNSMGLTEKIQRMKQERNAVILSHNYQADEVQDIADFVGDSLELSRTAASADCDIIVFCGVDFMAETAAILSPHKKVLLPARCLLPDGGNDHPEELNLSNHGIPMLLPFVTSIQQRK
jgi:quinolinate synthase